MCAWVCSAERKNKCREEKGEESEGWGGGERERGGGEKEARGCSPGTMSPTC